MEIVDGQIHTWEVRPTYPWLPPPASPNLVPVPNAVTAMPYESALAAMDAVGVSAAVLYGSSSYREVLPDGIVRYHNGYAEEAVAKHPGRFRAIAHVDHRERDLDERVAELRRRPGIVALREVFREGDLPALRAGEYEPLFVAATRHGMPLFMYLSGYLEDAVPIAAKHPNLRLVIDHFGLLQPPLRKPDSPPFMRLPDLLALARFPNVAVKICGAPTLSLEAYPYRDVWPHLRQVVDAFTPARLLWASDFTRCAPVHTYADAVLAVRYTDQLSEGEKEQLLGTTIRTLLNWPG